MVWIKKGPKNGGRCKVLVLLVAFMVLASSAFALYDSPNKILETYVCTNATGGYADTAISSTYIDYRYHRIIGYHISPYNGASNSELVVSLWDAADTQTAANMFDELEVSVYGNGDITYPYPKKLATGLTVRQGPNTTVIVLIEDTRKY